MGRDSASIHGETDVESAWQQPFIRRLWSLENGSTSGSGRWRTGRSASACSRRRCEEEREAGTRPREARGYGARSGELRASPRLTPAAIRLPPDDLGVAAPRRLTDQRADDKELVAPAWGSAAADRPRLRRAARLVGRRRTGVSPPQDIASRHAVPSRVRRICFASTPPTYCPIEPSLRTTRWHGTTTGMGLVAHAVPTARTALGLPAATAMAA